MVVKQRTELDIVDNPTLSRGMLHVNEDMSLIMVDQNEDFEDDGTVVLLVTGRRSSQGTGDVSSTISGSETDAGAQKVNMQCPTDGRGDVRDNHFRKL